MKYECEQLSQEDKIVYKNILLETYKVFFKFCQKHNIKYMGGYGTAIGAVRHHGLIPWDDDIDVIMMRKDYDNFISFKKELEGSGYEIKDYHDDGYNAPFAKFMDSNTTIWEDKYRPSLYGVFIDIFPLDEYDKESGCVDKCYYNKIWRRVAQSYRPFSFERFWKGICSFNIAFIKDEIQHLRLYGRRESLVQKYDQLTDAIKLQSGDSLICYCIDMPGYNTIYKKEWFDDVVSMPYEDSTIFIPKGYNEYLTSVYGDYMKLPPVEKRKSQHYHYFVDLTRRWSIEEILRKEG